MLAKIQKPAFLWGAPGVGKSQVVAQVAAALAVRLIDIRAILLDPVDLRGLPTVAHGKAAWATPAFLPDDGAGILFLDELNAAPPLVQAACYQLVLDRALGEYRLPDGWTVFAASNREGDRAVTSRMSSALANRFVHLSFEPDLDDWSRWAMGQADLRPEVVAFLRWRPDLLHRFEPADKAFPSPRAWASVSHILAATPPADIEFALYEGTVGRGAAIEFTGFLRVFRALPSLDGILLNPATAPVPDEPSALCAVATGLARRATDQNFTAANYLGYQAHQQTLEDKFGRAVRDFVASYPDYVETARKALNGLFDPRDYPAPTQISGKFAVRRHFMPVAQPDDFRVRLGDAQVARIRAEIEARNAELIQNANRDLWQRVHEVTTRLVDRLSAFEIDPIAGTRLHPFRDSLIENVRSLLEIMPRLNLTDDADIERVRHDLASKVACHDPETLREDRTLRAEVVDAASTILAQMEGYC